MEHTRRTIHFYELRLLPSIENTVEILFYDVFRHIIALNQQKDQERFIQGPGYLSCTREILIRPHEGILQGKILRIRMDSFPELMNVVEDVVKDIEKGENDGVVETTHFMIKYTARVITVAIEYNQFGAKINELKWYIDYYLRQLGHNHVLEYIPIVKDDFETYFRRINKCSSLTVKVHKNNVRRVEEFSEELFSALNAAMEIGESEYVELFIKFDYQKRTNTPEITNKAISWLRSILGNKEKAESIFDDFTLKAEDADQNFRLEYFDFISNKVKSLVNVEMRPQSRSIVSADMNEKLERELNNKLT